MTEQWQELKETITEMRDNGGTGTQQEVCKFLANYMEILEKQMQQPCEDCISRDAVDEYITNLLSGYLYDEERTRLEDLSAFVWELPSVTPKAESEDEYKKGYSDGFRDCLDKNVFCIESEE